MTRQTILPIVLLMFISNNLLAFSQKVIFMHERSDTLRIRDIQNYSKAKISINTASSVTSFEMAIVTSGDTNRYNLTGNFLPDSLHEKLKKLNTGSEVYFFNVQGWNWEGMLVYCQKRRYVISDKVETPAGYIEGLNYSKVSVEEVQKLKIFKPVLRNNNPVTEFQFVFAPVEGLPYVHRVLSDTLTQQSLNRITSIVKPGDRIIVDMIKSKGNNGILKESAILIEIYD
ncbi:MAG: hypothetical protein GC181_06470 [Bacteroidetes bacterium]|nr:hypothetical protein [Bacteroidota bacterium]